MISIYIYILTCTGLAKTQLFERLRYILEVGRIPATVDCTLDALVTMATHSRVVRALLFLPHR